MNSFNNIVSKLNKFTKKYYTKLLVKGVLLFVALGVLFFMVILGVEYFLWLNSTGRFILLFLFIAVELFLVYKFIATPIFYLLKLKNGITNKDASVLIGKHFPEVGDKLYNLLDLADDKNESELLLASIDQRSKNLDTIAFTKAVNFKESYKYAKYVAIPLVILGLLWFSGNFSSFFSSYKRVVNYDTAYVPPAPFSFNLLTPNLDVLETESYTAQVITEGTVRPDNVFIVIDGKEYLLQEENSVYSYTFTPPLKPQDFYFISNGIKSINYNLNPLKTPSIQRFSLLLDYPSYTNKPSEVIQSTGNAVFPEGTKVTWNIEGKHTENIQLLANDTVLNFHQSEEKFNLSKRIYKDTPYDLVTSNKNVEHYEKLSYEFTVIKDGYPTIKVKQALDSLNPNVSYYSGETTDDFKVANIKLVYYPSNNTDNKQEVLLESPNTNYNQFYYTYPSGLRLDENKNYSFYFEVTDNDAIHKGKKTKSQVFTQELLNTDQIKNKELQNQQDIINNLDKSLEQFKEQKETLKEINKNQKEKSSLNFNEQRKVKDFLKKQEEQENLMQKFSKQLKENLKKGDKEDPLNKLLQERLERQEIEAKKNEKLLDDLNKIADKIKKEELVKKLEELAKKQQNSERNLEQLLELTKRYYVTEKASQLAKDLEKLAKKQEDASKNEKLETKEEEQKELNKEFKELVKELEELKKDNKQLKKPLDLNTDESKEEDIKKEQSAATEEIQKEKSENASEQEKKDAGKEASKKQKSAADKMQQMGEQLEQSSSASSDSESIAEDAEMLRQILDNLVTFSFKQEGLYDALSDKNTAASKTSMSVRKQQELRNLFEHVDDSLFSLSLRRAELSEFVNEQITNVYYNIDKALENLAENRIYKGVSNQQYVLTASNSLADFLADILGNMQQSMSPGSGEGESGEGFQLPDIIKGQGELGEKMGKEGQKGKGKQGKKPGEGKSGGEEGKGEKRKDGKKGGEGDGEGAGENGQGGKSGNGKDGKGNGKGGENGSSQGQGELGEQELEEIYEIYKEQQAIRQLLENQLADFINSKDKQLAQKLVKQMEDFENDLLENGITQRTVNKVNNIEHQLLKLENAALKQGKKSEREGTTNKTDFSNPITTKPSLLDNYRNEVEILNRQALPLRQIYQTKVKAYFKNDD